MWKLSCSKYWQNENLQQTLSDTTFNGDSQKNFMSTFTNSTTTKEWYTETGEIM